MSDFNFTLKEGDFVYIPSAYSTPQKVKSIKGTNLFKVDYFTFFDSGYLFQSMTNPAGKIIFPATQEWYEKLVVIYPNLEKPPKRKSSKEIIQAMLDSGYNEVLAYVSDEPIEQILQKHKIALIYYIDSDGRFVASGDFEYDYAVPYCHKAGKKIIDFVDGKEILED